MSDEDLRRHAVMLRLEGGRLTTMEAAKVLGLSRRQVQRVRRRVEKVGAEGVVHQSRGRPSPRGTPKKVVAEVVRLMRTRYAGFNDQHFTEKLARVEGLHLSRSTVRRHLRRAGIGAARKRRPNQYRRRRDRKPQAGLMIQWDGSRHAWLEDRGPVLCLLGAVDDATSEFLPGAHFVEQECAAAYLRVLLAIVQSKGLPLSAYGDQHGSLKRNDNHWTIAEELRGEQDPTQVGRALKTLGIERIDALSPQAKGRVERLWGTLQDRLVSELRLVGARTCEQANAVLTRLLPEHNRRFAVPPADATPAWRQLPAGTDLERVCAFRYAATVLNDNTVRLGGQVIDIPPGPANRSYAAKHVEVVQTLAGVWRVYLRDRLLVATRPTPLRDVRPLNVRKRSAASRAFRAAALSL